MISPEYVSAVVVTRGDVDMAPIVESLSIFDEVLIWDNAEREDMSVYGRYAMIAEARNPVIFTQDDDVVLPLRSLRQLLSAYTPGELVANMPMRFRHEFYGSHCLVGFGSIFDHELPASAFAAAAHVPAITSDQDMFQRTCDIVFSALTPRFLVDVEYQDREFASAPNRMWKQPGHVSERRRMLELVTAMQVHA